VSFAVCALCEGGYTAWYREPTVTVCSICRCNVRLCVLFLVALWCMSSGTVSPVNSSWQKALFPCTFLCAPAAAKFSALVAVHVPRLHMWKWGAALADALAALLLMHEQRMHTWTC
jgi:hypothetical protein